MNHKPHRLFAVLRNLKAGHLIRHIAEVSEFDSVSQANTARIAGKDQWGVEGVEFFVRSGPIYPVADLTYEQLLERARES